jgi:cytochrome c
MGRSLSVLIALGGAALATCFFLAVQPLCADNSKGREIFERRCTGCHALDSEKDGPRLRGVYGRLAGTVPSFPYSQSVRNSGVTWDSSTLDKWLTDPTGFIPDNDMAFRVPNREERAAIIDYLKDISGK